MCHNKDVVLISSALLLSPGLGLGGYEQWWSLLIVSFTGHTNQKHFHLHTLAAQMQWYCRAIVCEELAQGPYIVTVSDEA